MGGFDELKPYQKYSKRILNRANERHKRVIDQSRAHIEGKRILDLGSHDGRWQWAALRAGAIHVTGIEGREHLVRASKKILAEFPSNHHATICGDVFEILAQMAATQRRAFDTILCLGIIYHVMDHYRLLSLMTDLEPNAIIIDGGLIDSDRLFVEVIKEPADSNLNAIPDGSTDQYSLAGFVSAGLMSEFVTRLGWNIFQLQWERSDVESIEGIEDYLARGEGKRRRYTFVLTRRSERQVKDFPPRLMTSSGGLASLS